MDNKGIMNSRMATELEERKKVFEDQNKLLDQLHNSVLNTRQFALTIGDELGEQDKMLNQLHSGVDEATEESRRQQRSVVQLLKDTKDSGFYCCVAVLVVVIIVLVVI
jgi:member of the syntaxin family of t-SNAREs